MLKDVTNIIAVHLERQNITERNNFSHLYLVNLVSKTYVFEDKLIIIIHYFIH